MLFTDLIEVKKILQIPLEDRSQDYALSYYVRIATDMIGEFLNRPGFDRKSRTEFYNGPGTQKLLLRSRPVLSDPEPQCWVDAGGFYGESENAFASNTQLTYGKDFGLWLDTDDDQGVMNKSRCGILVRKNDFWPKPTIREQGYLSPYVSQSFGNVKVTYTGGYTLEDMPSQLRLACVMCVGRIRAVMPMAVPISSESYEERSISYDLRERNFLLGQVKPLLFQFKNWKF